MKGNLQVSGSIAYVEQEPFIISASIRKNILFGKPYDKKRFDEAIKFAQLERDVAT